MTAQFDRRDKIRLSAWFRWRLLLPLIVVTLISIASYMALLNLSEIHSTTINHLKNDELAVIKQLSRSSEIINLHHQAIIETVESATESNDAAMIYDRTTVQLDALYDEITKLKNFKLVTHRFDSGEQGREINWSANIIEALDRYYWAQSTAASMVTVSVNELSYFLMHAENSLSTFNDSVHKVVQSILVEVEQDSKKQEQYLQRTRGVTTFIVSISFLLSILWAMSRMLFFSKHLQQIASSLRYLANGDTNIHLPKVSNDPDLRSMVDSLHQYRVTHNSLSSALQRLSNLNDTLEQRVEERTHSLKQEVTERRRAEKRLELFAKAFDQTDEAIVITNSDAKIIYVNSAHARLTGYSSGEVIGKNPNMFKSDRHDDTFYEQMWQSLNQEKKWSGEIWDRRKSGEIYPKYLTINYLHDQESGTTHYVGIFRDISDTKQTELHLENMAYHDGLTGLYNREKYFSVIETLIKRHRRYNEPFTLMYLDLDGFKPVNDKLGHAAGDEVLRVVSARLRTRIRDVDSPFRMGGDEFSLLIPNVTDTDDISAFASRLIQTINMPTTIGNTSVTVGASIGIAVHPQDGETPESITNAADNAMYKAKQRGKNQFYFYSSNNA